MKTLTIKTKKKGQVHDLTDEINSILKKESIEEGTCTIYIKHTTAALTVADMDPGSEEDYIMAFDKLIPDLDYKHPHDPKHMPEHILAAIIGPSVTVPFKSSQLEIGTWQKVVLMEFSGPRERSVVVTFNKSD